MLGKLIAAAAVVLICLVAAAQADDNHSDTTAGSSATASATTSATAPAQWHRMRMRLSGSMCLACLNDFQLNLKKVSGVRDIKVHRTTPNLLSNLSPELGSWAEAVIIYDASKLKLLDLRAAIRHSGYTPFHISDASLNREPEERDLKL